MVAVDNQLLFDARRLINGANVHRLKEMIFAYEQAVDLHNRRCPRHEIYRIQCELRLRNYVRELKFRTLTERTIIAIDRAQQAQTLFGE